MLKKLSPILLLNFVNVIGFTILIPVLPSVTSQLVNDDIQPIVYGVLLSSYSFFQFLAAPIIGAMSDKYGRKNLLLISQLGTALSWVVFGAAWFIPTDKSIGGVSLALIAIAISRIADGITGGNVSVANAWVSDMTTKEEKTAAFGMMSAVFGGAFLIGPVIGGLSSTTKYGYLGTAVVAFFISIVTLLLIWFRLPESLPEEKRDKEFEMTALNQINIFKQIEPFKYNRNISYLLLLRVFLSIVFSSYTTIVILLLEGKFKLSEYELGALLAVIAIFSVINQLFLVKKLAKKFGNFHTLYIGIIFIAVGLFTIPLIPIHIAGSITIGLILLVINAYLFNVGISVGQPTFKSIITNEVPDNKQGKITGLDESLLSLGNGISPILAGVLYASFDVNTFYIFAIVLVIPAIYAYINLKDHLHKDKILF